MKLDKKGNEFDPNIHESADGIPVYNATGTFRRKPGRKKGSTKEVVARRTLQDEQDSERIVTDQLFKSAKQFKYKEKKIDAVRKIADNIVEMACDGDKWAIQFFTERVEGKATQKTEVKSNHTVHVIKDFSDEVDLKAQAKLIEGELLEDVDLEEVKALIGE